MASKKKIQEDVELETNDEIEEFEEEFENISLEERIISIEKKTNATFILLIIVMILSFISLIYTVSNKDTQQKDTNTNQEQESDGIYDTSAFTEIKAVNIESLSKDKTIVIMVGRQGCGWCSEYAPMFLTLTSEYKTTPYYIDLAKILDFSNAASGQVPISDKDSYEIMISLSGAGEWATFAKEKFGGTPLTLIIKDNKVIGGLGGYPRNGISDARSAFESAGLKK